MVGQRVLVKNDGPGLAEVREVSVEAHPYRLMTLEAITAALPVVLLPGERHVFVVRLRSTYGFVDRLKGRSEGRPKMYTVAITWLDGAGTHATTESDRPREGVVAVEAAPRVCQSACRRGDLNPHVLSDTSPSS